MPAVSEIQVNRETDRPQHECGIFAIYHPTEPILTTTYYGLMSLQHRGQEAAGVATSDGQDIHVKKDTGLVMQVLGKPGDLADLSGHFAISHVRYGTTGSPTRENAQPMLVEDPWLGPMALVHNGNVFNSQDLRHELELFYGEWFDGTSDSEVIARVIARAEGATWQEKIRNSAQKFEGGFSLVILTKDELIGVRDAHGFWPLVLGEFNQNGFALASESAAFVHTGIEFKRSVEPGEIVTIRSGSVSQEFLGRDRKRESFCVFEAIYFSSPQTEHFDRQVGNMRFDMGRALWRKAPVDADWVVPIPETGRHGAEGISFESRVPYRTLLDKNRNVGRTFIEPDQRLREIAAALKFAPNREILRGARIIVPDDSIVRGTTTKRIVELFREAGTKEVHLRIFSPPIKWPCVYGIDTADRDELIAANMTVREITEFVGADSLVYLDLEDVVRAVGKSAEGRICHACFTGEYPTSIPAQYNKRVLEKV